MKKPSRGLLIARYIAVTLGFWMFAFSFPISIAMLAVGHCPEEHCQIAGRHALWRGVAVSMIPYAYMLWRCHRAWRAEGEGL